MVLNDKKHPCVWLQETDSRKHQTLNNNKNRLIQSISDHFNMLKPNKKKRVAGSMVVMVNDAGGLLRLVQVEVHKNKEVCL